jgi:hypothetical protein
MKKTQKGFGSAENKDQNQFDKVQLSLSNDDRKKQTSALVELFRRKEAESLAKKQAEEAANAIKQEAILDQPSGKQTDPILKHLQSRGVQVTQEMYLAYAHPEGMDAETEAMLPEEFHDLPKK